jgi:hypothetical protein
MVAAEPPPPEPRVAPAPPPPQAPRQAGLSGDDLSKLQAALRELAECRKLIEEAVARPD